MFLTSNRPSRSLFTPSQMLSPAATNALLTGKPARLTRRPRTDREECASPALLLGFWANAGCKSRSNRAGATLNPSRLAGAAPVSPTMIASPERSRIQPNERAANYFTQLATDVPVLWLKAGRRAARLPPRPGPLPQGAKGERR